LHWGLSWERLELQQQYSIGSLKKAEEPLVFAKKNFFDLKSQLPNDGFVSVSGTLRGNGIAYPNNTYGITCVQDRKECWISYVQQIGRNQVGRIDAPTPYPISKWQTNEIVATSERSELACNKLTITIDRNLEQALFLQEPINQTHPRCKDSDTGTHKWTIESSLGWRKMFGDR
jgi:hypothetical protein